MDLDILNKSSIINLNCKYGYDNNLVSDINGYVTYEEAAKILGVSKSTVRSYVTNKKIQNKNPAHFFFTFNLPPFFNMFSRSLFIQEF